MAKSPEELQKLLNDLQSAYNKLGETNPYAKLSVEKLQNNTDEVKKLEDAFKGVNARINNISEDLDGIIGSIQSTANEFSKSNSALKTQEKLFRGIGSVATDLRNDALGIKSLSIDELKSLQSKLTLSQKNLKLNETQLIDRKKALIDQNKQGDVSSTQYKKNEEEITRINKAIAAGKAEYTKQGSLVNDLTEQAKKRQEEEEEINKALGLAPAILGGIGKQLQKLGLPDLGINKAVEKTKEILRNEEGRVTAGKALSVFSNQLKKNLIEQLTPANLIQSAMVGLFNALKNSDKVVGDMAKGLNMSYGEALDMKQELTAAAGVSDELFVTSKGMAESLIAINKTLGTNVMLNKEDLVTFTKLREVAGLTNEELMGIQSLTLSNGKSLEDNTKEILAQAKISSVKNGVILNEKEILKEVKDVSAATTLSLGKNPSLIAEAVATAKSLGIEMAQIEGIVSSLLDFESSIGNELQAELLLGKNINLEKARLAALNNDIATLSQEIANQIGDSADFTKMNRLQQDALAKSVGMSREELAKTLFVQDQLAGATGKEAEEKRRLINAQIESNGLAATQKKLGDEGFEALENQASMQDRFNQSVEKLKEIFVNIAEVTMPFFNGIANMVGMLAESKLTLMGITAALAAMSVIWTAIQIKSAIAALSALTMNSALTFGVGAVAALAAVGAAWATYKSMKPAGDLNSPAKGKTQISTKEGGLFELSPNDDIVAAPGASQALAQANQGQQPVVVQNGNKETNMLLKQILNKQGTVKMNATEVGTAFAVNTYEVQ